MTEFRIFCFGGTIGVCLAFGCAVLGGDIVPVHLAPVLIFSWLMGGGLLVVCYGHKK